MAEVALFLDELNGIKNSTNPSASFFCRSSSTGMFDLSIWLIRPHSVTLPLDTFLPSSISTCALQLYRTDSAIRSFAGESAIG